MSIFLVAAFFVTPAFAQSANVEFGKPANSARPPSQSGAEEAKVIGAIFKAMNPQKSGAGPKGASGTSRFSVSTCQIPVHKWAQFALMGTPIHQNFVFKEGCDVQGSLTITQKPFP